MFREITIFEQTFNLFSHLPEKFENSSHIERPVSRIPKELFFKV